MSPKPYTRNPKPSGVELERFRSLAVGFEKSGGSRPDKQRSDFGAQG